jgi:uncharacterized repeat protein (TIGR01451 family)
VVEKHLNCVSDRQIGAFLSRLRALFAFALLCLMPSMASAQTVNQYTNTTTGNIVDSTNCATTVSRTFVVGTSYVVSDVDLGVFLTHTYRSDLRISLTSPGGTTVNIMGNTAGDGDNLNDRFDDEATSSITAHSAATADSTTAPPPYSHSFQPGFSSNPNGYATTLSAFDGQNALGTWTMVICDSANQDTGTFTRADLYITQPPTSYADLSLTKTVSNATPANGASISYTLTASSAAASNLTATGVTVLDSLPLGVTFNSASGTGSYNSTTGVWSVGTLAPGASAAITITVTVTATSAVVVTNGAEISASSVVDSDSTPNNGSTAEDDDAFVSFTVSGTRVAGTPPTLTCPSGSSLFDWGTQSWTSGSLNNSYTITGIGLTNFALNTDFPFVTGSPAINGTLTGGLAGEVGLFQNMNNDTTAQAATTVITLPTAVPGLQFRVFDIDFGAASYADKLTVTGSFNGSAVTPTLTNGVSNYVLGNIAIGDAGATDTTANGTVVITFSSPVDTVTLRYGNYTTAPANPGNQYMAVHDITICNPVANLSVTKLSNVVSDNVSASNPKALPGATVHYCILVSNAGSATATNISVGDPIPPTVTFLPGSILSGTSCAAATTPEDDNATGADESDPFGVSVTGTTLTGIAASLGPTASFAIVFNATVN